MKGKTVEHTKREDKLVCIFSLYSISILTTFRYSTPAANSRSTSRAPNPEVGPKYWPDDAILNIDYRAFEERSDDAAEPLLRVAPVHGTVAPNPTPVAPHAPVPQAEGPDSLELHQAIDAHTTSISGQKRLRDTDDEDEADGLIERSVSQRCYYK